MIFYLYGGRTAELGWKQNRDALATLRNLTVTLLRYESVQDLSKLAERSMTLQVTIQETHLWLTDGEHAVEGGTEVLQGIVSSSVTAPCGHRRAVPRTIAAPASPMAR